MCPLGMNSQSLPTSSRSRPHIARERREMPPLLAHAAEIDAARLRSDRALLREADAQAVAAELQRRGAALDAAADDCHVDAKSFRHGELVHGMGIGFTGGWPRRRPTSAIGRPVCA